jgi:hypothetical protein
LNRTIISPLRDRTEDDLITSEPIPDRRTDDRKPGFFYGRNWFFYLPRFCDRGRTAAPAGAGCGKGRGAALRRRRFAGASKAPSSLTDCLTRPQSGGSFRPLRRLPASTRTAAIPPTTSSNPAAQAVLGDGSHEPAESEPDCSTQNRAQQYIQSFRQVQYNLNETEPGQTYGK